MDWNNCVESSIAIKVSPNRERSLSLLKSAKNTARFVTSIGIDESNAPILLKNYYEALLELVHSLLYKKGYKVLDHVCAGYFIRDVIEDVESFRIFDKYRKIRNSIVYYGESQCVVDDEADIIIRGREHNNSNILSLGARYLTEESMLKAVDLWLKSPYSGTERHVRRLAKIDKIKIEEKQEE